MLARVASTTVRAARPMAARRAVTAVPKRNFSEAKDWSKVEGWEGDIRRKLPEDYHVRPHVGYWSVMESRR
jgi:hypothetical protein